MACKITGNFTPLNLFYPHSLSVSIAPEPKLFLLFNSSHPSSLLILILPLKRSTLHAHIGIRAKLMGTSFTSRSGRMLKIIRGVASLLDMKNLLMKVSKYFTCIFRGIILNYPIFIIYYNYG